MLMKILTINGPRLEKQNIIEKCTGTATKEELIGQNMKYDMYEGVLVGPEVDKEGNKLQRPNSGFIQHTPHEDQYNS